MKKNIVEKIIRKLSPFQRAKRKWFKSEGDNTYRLDYYLDENAVVFDLGGYKGDFTQKILDKFNCTCMIFEPVPFYVENIQHRFSNNEKVKVYPFAVGGRDSISDMVLHEDGSSIFNKYNGERIKIETKNICEFIRNNGINRIDLMKINIEGGEYELLESIINDSDVINRIDNLQIQFHNIKEINSKNRMRKICKRLKKTHFITWKFRPYVWENWKKK